MNNKPESEEEPSQEPSEVTPAPSKPRRNFKYSPPIPLDPVIPFGTTPPDAPAPSLPVMVDALDLISNPPEEPPEVVKGVLHQGAKLILGGGSKSYKTWVLTDLAVSVASGRPWLNFPTVKGKVLFINFEIAGAFYARRLKQVAEAKSTLIERGDLTIWNLRGHATEIQKLRPQIEENCAGKGFGLIIFDPIYKLQGGEENAAWAVTELVRELDLICENTKAAVAFGDHFSKGNQSSKEAMDRISGSGVKARDPDAILTLTRHEEDFCFTVDTSLRNHPPVPPFVVKWDFPLMNYTDLAPEDLKQIPAQRGRTAKRHESAILDFMNEKGDLVTHGEALQAMEGQGWGKTAFNEKWQTLKHQKKIEESVMEPGKWSPSIRV